MAFDVSAHPPGFSAQFISANCMPRFIFHGIGRRCSRLGSPSNIPRSPEEPPHSGVLVQINHEEAFHRALPISRFCTLYGTSFSASGPNRHLHFLVRVTLHVILFAYFSPTIPTATYFVKIIQSKYEKLLQSLLTNLMFGFCFQVQFG